LAYVNLPGARRIGVVDSATRRELAPWPNGSLKFNYPLALDRETGRVATAYRLPAKVAIFDAASGVQLQVLDTCSDADDLFFDGKRQRLYIICGGGGGAVGVFEFAGRTYRSIARVPSRGGARTGLFAPQLDRLYVAARAGSGNRDAAILVYRPLP
jgi:hypothetical protein